VEGQTAPWSQLKPIFLPFGHGFPLPSWAKEGRNLNPHCGTPKASGAAKNESCGSVKNP
jgi:hypothetical protein